MTQLDEGAWVLTLWEPWATLLVFGFKEIETRPAPVNYRPGDKVYIHAAKRFGPEQRAAMEEPYIRQAFERLDKVHNGNYVFRLGSIIGEVQFEGFEPIRVRGGEAFVGNTQVSSIERTFGDYRNGRYAWIFKNPKPIKYVPYKGMQGYYHKFKQENLIQ